jgi:exonuclease III
MKRAAAVLMFAAGMAVAAAPDPQAEARETVAAFAGGLSNDNPELALSYVDKTRFPGYEAFARNLRALLQQFEVTSSIAPVGSEGTEEKQVVQLDWYVEIRAKSGELELVRRRETVRCTVERVSAASKKWRITNLDPSRLLELPRLPR